MSITTTGVLPAPVQQSFSYKLLSVPVPYMIHKIPAYLKHMPRNGGTTLRMRRYNPLPTAPVPLGNSGITPPPVELTAVNIDATMDFYGKPVSFSDLLKLAVVKLLVITGIPKCYILAKQLIYYIRQPDGSSTFSLLSRLV